MEGTRQVFTYCVDDATEALTRRGWKKRTELTTDDHVLSIDTDTDEIRWEPVLAVNEFDWSGPLVRWQNTRVDALTTPNHRWIAQDWRARDPRYTHLARNGWKTTEELSSGRGSNQVLLGGGTPLAFADEKKWSDEMVETIGWVITEGYFAPKTGVILAQSEEVNPEYVSRIRRLAKWWRDEGAYVSEHPSTNCIHWYFGKGANQAIRDVAPEKQLTPEFLCSLTYHQARLLYETVMAGDGHVRVEGTETWAQKDVGRLDGFQMLCAMLGRRSHTRKSAHHSGSEVTVYKNRWMTAREVGARKETYEGKVWCPSVRTKTWFARRNGVTYWTGNTELITESQIEEYVNDELLDSRPNPLGIIPIAHIPNIPVSGSPWGLADIQDVVSLNREYNEKATDISDIVNYHAAPVTVITGAKASNLEKGPKKVWGGLPKDSQVFNLELQGALDGPLAFMALLKTAMHEMVGVPESALGQMQPISNTSGVALAIQFQPAMRRHELKTMTYGNGIEQINEIALLTLYLNEPETLAYDPNYDTPLKEENLPVLDPGDPISYQTFCNWESPLPVDLLIKLNEIQAKMGIGLESKRGALRDMGEEFPDEKMLEIFEELVQDAKEQGALDLLRNQIAAAIQEITGIPVVGSGPDGGVASAGGPNVNNAPGPGNQMAPMQGDQGQGVLPGVAADAQEVQDMLNQLVTIAYGTKLPQRRNPSSND